MKPKNRNIRQLLLSAFAVSLTVLSSASSVFAYEKIYTTEELTGEASSLFTYTSYTVDPTTGEYKPVDYELFIDAEIGDTTGVDKVAHEFKWAKTPDDVAFLLTKLLTSGSETPDFTFYTTENERLYIVEENADIVANIASQVVKEDFDTGEELFNKNTTTKDEASAINIVGLNNINSLTGNFANNDNRTYRPNEEAKGGTVSIVDVGSVGTIHANFVGNISSSAGAGLNLNNVGSVDLVTGSYIGNTSREYGAGLRLLNDSYVKEVQADFIGNFAKEGAGLHINKGSVIDSLTGDFINNISLQEGGALMMFTFDDDVPTHGYSTIGELKSNFYGNTGLGKGGAAYLDGIIGSATGDYIGNNSGEEGGAFYLANGASLGLLALDKSMEMTGNSDNYNFDTETGTSNALHFTVSAKVSMNAYGENTIKINDAITSENLDTNHININNGKTGSNTDIDNQGKAFNTVELNNNVSNISITVYNDELKLSSFAGSTVAAASTAQLDGTILVGRNSSTVTADDAKSLGTHNTHNQIAMLNNSQVRLLSGTLENDILFTETASMMAAAGVTLNSVLTATNDKGVTFRNEAGDLARLDGVTLGREFDSRTAPSFDFHNGTIQFNEPNVIIEDTVDNTDLDIYSFTTKANIGDINGSLTLDILLENEEQFLIDYIDGGLAVLLKDEDNMDITQLGYMDTVIEDTHIYFNGIKATVNGVQNYDNGLLFFVAIPEPSTATLSLLALAGLLTRRRRRVAAVSGHERNSLA